MAVRFVGPVGDIEEVSLQAGAIPNGNYLRLGYIFMSGMCEWAGSRAMKTADVDEIVPLITPLLNIWLGNFRATPNTKMKCVHLKGLGTSSKQAEPITLDEESLLWTSRQVGTHSWQRVY